MTILINIYTNTEIEQYTSLNFMPCKYTFAPTVYEQTCTYNFMLQAMDLSLQ